MFSRCASPCTKTCENYQTLMCADACEAQCACPANKPIFDQGRCIMSYQCPATAAEG